MKKLTTLFLVFSILLLSGNMFAKERKGADLIVQKTDGTQVRGELIAVKQNSLLLLERDSGADVTVDITEINVVRIIKKSKAGVGLLAGGAIGAFVGYLTYSETEGWMDFGPGLNAGVGAVLGALIGLVTGAFEGTDKTIQIEGKSDAEIQEILEKLRKKARVRNAQ